MDYLEKIIRKNVEDIVQEEMNKAVQNFIKDLGDNKARYVDAAMKAIEVSRSMDGTEVNYKIVVEHVMKKGNEDGN